MLGQKCFIDLDGRDAMLLPLLGQNDLRVHARLDLIVPPEPLARCLQLQPPGTRCLLFLKIRASDARVPTKFYILVRI